MRARICATVFDWRKGREEEDIGEGGARIHLYACRWGGVARGGGDGGERGGVGRAGRLRV